MPEYRSIQGELKVLQSDNDFIFPVELWLLNDKVNRNNWQFINLEEHRAKWAGKPILVAYVNGGRTAGDGHNQVTRIDRNGKEYQSFTDATAERICGALSDEDSDIRLEERDGALWTVGRGFLWAWYSHELCLQIANDARQGRSMSVSIEALVTKSRMEDGVEVEESYEPLGVTILGHGVAPAVADAHIAMLEEIGSELNELKLRAASYLNVDSQKPQNESNGKGVNKRMNFSKQQLKELQEKFGAEYKVLDAQKTQDGATRVMLMRKRDKAFFSYDVGEKDSAVYQEKFAARAALIVLSAEDGEEQMCADAGETICEECAEAAEAAKCAEDRAECAERELSEAKETISRMENAENSRRLSAAKKKATDTLDAFNANRENKVDAKVLEALNKDIEAGKFTALSDENGAWTGETAVEEKVLSLCAAAVMEQDKRSAAKPMTWGSVKQASANPGTIGELFASKN